MRRPVRAGTRLAVASLLAAVCFAASLMVGRYPISWGELFSDSMSSRVFFTLRLPRTCMALVAGFVLGVAGSVYQTILRNPLASPDIIGVSSGASAGAAAAILFLGGGAVATTLLAFLGGFAAVLAVLALSALTRWKGPSVIILSGIAVNALSQALLMLMKLTADPERELAAIEFWTMGSLAGITQKSLWAVLPWVALGLFGVMLLHRQILLLGLDEDEAGMLGVPVRRMRRAVLLLATLATGAVVSVTGLISFAGLLAPHIARLITRSSRFSTTLLAGIAGGILLLVSDMIVRSVGAGELPISIVTSLLGVPFLVWLVCRRGERYD